MMRFRQIFSRGVFLGLCLALTAFRASAQRYTYQQENRFLIIVETSSAMRKSSNAVSQAVSELFRTQMKGELRRRDTIGIWTYNDELHTEFPMQVWRGTNGERIEENVMRYLEEERYEKRGHLDKVLPVVGKVIGQSERLTVIFIFDGSEPVTGTPFDLDINETHKKFRSDFKSKHIPFVTTISAKFGRIFDYTVSSPGAIKLPHTALPAQPDPSTNPPVVVAPRPPVAPPQPHKYTEIVMSGASLAAARAAAATNTETVPAPAPLATNEAAAPVVSNEPVAVVPPAQPATNPPPAAPPLEVAAPVTNATTNVAATQTSPTPTPPPEARPAPDVVAAPAAPQVAPTPRPISTPSTPAAMTAQQTASLSGVEEIALLVIAFSLAAIALALVWFFVRRGRAGGSGSLISQSMDRPR